MTMWKLFNHKLENYSNFKNAHFMFFLSQPIFLSNSPSLMPTTTITFQNINKSHKKIWENQKRDIFHSHIHKQLTVFPSSQTSSHSWKCATNGIFFQWKTHVDISTQSLLIHSHTFSLRMDCKVNGWKNLYDRIFSTFFIYIHIDLVKKKSMRKIFLSQIKF